MENSGSQAPVPLGESQPQVPQNAGVDQINTMVAQKRPWLRSLEFAALALSVLILLVAASYILPFVAVLEALNMAAPFVGIIFTLTLAIGCGEIVWQEFRRTNSGQTERAGSFDSTVKIGIILMIIGVPLLFLGIGALVLLEAR